MRFQDDDGSAAKMDAIDRTGSTEHKTDIKEDREKGKGKTREKGSKC